MPNTVDRRLTVRLTEEQEAAVRREAAACGLGPSTWIRLLICRALNGRGLDSVTGRRYSRPVEVAHINKEKEST